jgi:hypothetical protein
MKVKRTLENKRKIRKVKELLETWGLGGGLDENSPHYEIDNVVFDIEDAIDILYWCKKNLEAVIKEEEQDSRNSDSHSSQPGN